MLRVGALASSSSGPRATLALARSRAAPPAARLVIQNRWGATFTAPGALASAAAWRLDRLDARRRRGRRRLRGGAMLGRPLGPGEQGGLRVDLGQHCGRREGGHLHDAGEGGLAAARGRAGGGADSVLGPIQQRRAIPLVATRAIAQQTARASARRRTDRRPGHGAPCRRRRRSGCRRSSRPRSPRAREVVADEIGEQPLGDSAAVDFKSRGAGHRARLRRRSTIRASARSGSGRRWLRRIARREPARRRAGRGPRRAIRGSRRARSRRAASRQPGPR